MAEPSAAPRRGTGILVVIALLAIGIALPEVAVASAFHGARPRAITLTNPTVFTDDPLVAGVTTIKREHLLQLRAAINFYRTAAGLPGLPFTDDQPVVIKAFYIAELRNALDPALAALNLPALSYSDPTIDETTPIKAAHLQEIREAARVIVIVCGIAVTNPTASVSTVGQPFSEFFTQNGAIGTSAFTIASGTLPNGLNLAPNGLLSGTPTQTGSFPITIHVTDENKCGATSATYNLEIVAAPSIASFVAAPVTITNGGSSQLTANFAGGSAVITNNGDESTIAPASGIPAGVSPSLSTTYTLTVTNTALDSVTATASVTVVPPPTATTFVASPDTITAGTSSQLTATFTGGTGVITFNTGPGSINAASGTPVSVSPLSTTTYTLTVTNAAGTSATLTATVTVIPPPTISSFTATPDHFTVGDSSTLAATFSGTSATIVSAPPGTSTPIASGGTFPVSPASTTVYTLTVLNALGATVSANVTVTVVPQPVCTSLDLSTTAITDGDFFIVTPFFSNGVATMDSSTDFFITFTSIPGPFTSGSGVFKPPVSCATDCTAEFRLTVTNPLGATCQAFSTFLTISPPPVITNFTSTATSVVANTGTFRMTPTFSGNSATILPGIGNTSSGSQTAQLTIPSSRTYTLKVSNLAGKTVTRTLTVNTTGTLTASAALTAGRFEATATRLPNGKVLIAGGSLTNGGVGLQTGTVFDPATNSYTATGNLTTARANHTATLLPNGKVLLAGGRDGAGATLATLELYDMIANTFSTVAAPLGAPRTGHTATLLPNGNVLIAGGSGTNSVDLFVSSSSTVTTLSGAAGAIAIRQAHTATLLPNGKVWLAGGGTNTTEFFDWTNNTFLAGPGLAFTPSNATATLMSNGLVLIAGGTASRLDVQTFDYTTTTLSASSLGGGMAVARTKASATPLPDGRVLIEGGEQTAAASASLFDPVNVSFAATPAPSAVHVTAFTALLGNGKVFFGGGGSTATQIFDPGLSTPHLLTATGPMEGEREHHTLTLLPNGQGLVIGGQEFTFPNILAGFADLFVDTNDAAGHFRAGGFIFSGTMVTPRHIHTATLLPNGKVLVAGGFGTAGPVSQAEIWDNGTFTNAGVVSMRFSHTATLLPNAKVLLAGGSTGSSATNTVDLYDVATGTISAAAAMITPRSNHTATLLPNGKVLVAAGMATSGVTGTAELYDPIANTWTAVPAPPAGLARQLATATLLPNGKVLIAGGINSNFNPSAGAFLYDWATNTLTTTAPMFIERSDASASLLPDGKVLVSGGRGFFSGLDTTEIYDPATDTWSFGASLAQPVFAHRSILLGNGKVLVTGGEADSNPISASSVFQ